MGFRPNLNGGLIRYRGGSQKRMIPDMALKRSPALPAAAVIVTAASTAASAPAAAANRAAAASAAAEALVVVALVVPAGLACCSSWPGSLVLPRQLSHSGKVKT